MLKWLRTRYSHKSLKEYRFSQSELEKNKEIENIFYLFDSDKSGTLEMSELENVSSATK